MFISFDEREELLKERQAFIVKQEADIVKREEELKQKELRCKNKEVALDLLKKDLSYKIKNSDEVKDFYLSEISLLGIKQEEFRDKEKNLDNIELAIQKEITKNSDLIEELEDKKNEDLLLSNELVKQYNILDKNTNKVIKEKKAIEDKLYINECALREIHKVKVEVREKELIVAGLVKEYRLEEKVKQLEKDK